jgi:siroheme synthase-like protein
MLLYFFTDGMKALVVGAGKVGRRKIFKLIEGGADVTVVTKDVPDGIDEKVKVIIGDGLEYALQHIDEFKIVVAATNDPTVNSKIAQLALQNGKLVNSVTSTEDCNIAFPAVIDGGNYLLGITTGGRDPSLSKRLKKTLKKAITRIDV